MELQSINDAEHSIHMASAHKKMGNIDYMLQHLEKAAN